VGRIGDFLYAFAISREAACVLLGKEEICALRSETALVQTACHAKNGAYSMTRNLTSSQFHSNKTTIIVQKVTNGHRAKNTGHSLCDQGADGIWGRVYSSEETHKGSYHCSQIENSRKVIRVEPAIF